MFNCLEFCSFEDWVQLAAVNRQYREDFQESFNRIGGIRDPFLTYSKIIRWLTERSSLRNELSTFKRRDLATAMRYIADQGRRILPSKDQALLQFFSHINENSEDRQSLYRKVFPRGPILHPPHMVNWIRRELSRDLRAIARIAFLDLGGLRASTLPDEIELFTNVTVINLDRSYISYLPKLFFNLKNLKVLRMSRALYLEELPAEVGLLTNLMQLFMTHIFLPPLPKTIHNLKRLQLVVISIEQEIEPRPFSIWNIFCCCTRGAYGENFAIVRRGEVHRPLHPHAD
jgi:hypothetical protein